MHNPDLIYTLTAGLAVALVLGFLTHRLGLSPIVGYLLAGIALGPHTPGFTAKQDIADQFAELGVILLMFGVGLHFHIEELWAVRRVALPGALVQSLVATLLGIALGWAVGWPWSAGLVFGLAISVASTVVLLRVLADNHELHTPTGHIAVGWLVVEDLFTVLVLVLLPVLFPRAPTAETSIVTALSWSVLKLGVLVVFTFLVGGRLIPWLLARVAATRSHELFTLTVLALALGIAVGSATFFGASMALGAFLAGMVVGRSEFSLRAAADALPMRDAFAVLFFVAAGMLFDPHYLLVAPGLVLATLAIILVGKPLTALLLVLLLGYPLRVAFAVSVALAQIGEFSFILANLGRELALLPDGATEALVTAALVSISLNPLIYRLIDPVEAWARRRPRLWRLLNARMALAAAGLQVKQEPTAQHRAVVIGHGPVGRTLVRLLRASDIEPTVVELNHVTVRQLAAEGTTAVYGDAMLRETLVVAGVERAIALLLSASGMRGAEEVIRLARELNPRIRVYARATYLREVPALRSAGADAVFAGEGEVALTLTEHLLRQLGATDEQIARERARIRTELFGAALAAEPLLKPPPSAERQDGEPV